ncbi:MAG TPA: methyltransferase domain-containing protein [Blastocatellia bacterium]|nr:methyltransferase domain-containing protein [Blastocatellia bacterium]
MSTAFQVSDDAAIRQRDSFAERLLKSTLGVFDIFTVYIGHRLGFYDALAGGDSLTSTELASRTQTCERYVREWLEQQAVAGILEVEDAGAEAKGRRFRLPAGHAEVLIDRDSLNYLAPLAQLAVGAVSPVSTLLKAYRSGAGVPYQAYGADLRKGQADMNRAMFLKQMGEEWLPAIPDLHARLKASPPARVADIGCGAGWSSIGIALAYPEVRVDGYDLDAPSIDMARANALQNCVSHRVSFHTRNANDPTLEGQYDLVTAFECIHDMSDPVGALQTMRGLAGESGSVIVVDERVGEEFTGERDEIEQLMYGWSVLHCLPVGMADLTSRKTGTVMRPETLRSYALEAGFRAVEVLPIDNLFFRFYRLRQ